ncbi:protein suppressor of sable-like [Contarinia nasturtii]|uniref:protein suppressor of sable-like n=1 Tax=Contarinia nasturtii TaxID=265458 RepID=UPI0012D48414|nr:protein suppressor of sable-like [Contarinia nasturtii]XP_031622128.1 protein suppressor of sable-like [Contarinia nasturtii]XP_031622130.1 protein suppressor of sable-like [Contarinia nasturtii]XP_031622131.1 protein suppressor of sable-like [Contarinia nasturtii]XP_031622132.1 protein suppressor of sable-like [Contarinia nasturtii]
MAELDSDPRSTLDDEDLEDGEIETDEENEEVKPVKPVASEPVKKPKNDDDSKKTNEVKGKNDSRKSAPDNSSAKSKKLSANDAIAKDDWMGDVENALAKALQKDGIAPKPVKINAKKANDEQPKDTKEQQKETKGESSSSKSSKHKRKHSKNDKELQRKKARLTDEEPERTYHSNESEDFDEYEMMNVRGGSPVQHGGTQGSQKQNLMYYDSDGSYSSYESDIGEQRRRNRAKRRANDRRDRRNHRGGHSKRDHKRRRGDDSDDENIGHSNNTGGNGGGGGGGNNRNNNNQPRKAELCKFYLMECCAKGEKCLYMHGDFPCKFYYLGMKNHNRENCKFSHGKPLTDQLRAVLLKHLETAPKEILGDFPRIARENAINMINAQHQKLLVKFGMEPEPNTTNTSNASQTSKLPSLLDINLDKYQPPSNNELGMGNMKKDKPRKSRWCDQRSNESNTNHSSQNSNNSTHAASNQSSNENEIKLSSFTNILTAEQLDKLTKMGIETVSQLSQLTILQVMELGLEIKVISELQLKASQLQQIKQIQSQQNQQQKSSQSSKTPSEPQNPFSPSSNETLSQDQDMRIALNTTRTNDKLELANQDVDMRILAIPHRTGLDRSKSDSFSKNTQSEKTNEQANASRKTIDYSQYLKDANIDLNQSDLEDQLVSEPSKGKKKGYDSDEDEGNPLVIEEEDDPMHAEEPNSDNDESGIQRANDDATEYNSQASTYYDSQCDLKNDGNSIPSPDPSGDSASQNENILPPYYASSSMYPTSIPIKIDLSSSVSQLLKKEDSVQKTDSYIKKVDSGFHSEPIDGNDSPNQSSSTGTSFYSRQIPETNHPAPQALDEKPSPSVDYDSPSETNARISSPVSAKLVRKCIYEVSSDDDEANDDKIRSPSDDDDSQDSRSKNIFSLSKDKDMRIPPIFLEKDFSNGDIDLRLPFKPMVNYIPATEIDASITSHAPITYEVKEVDIPKPDYSELRKNFNAHENTLDPRLRRILRIKDNYSESETNFSLSTKASPFSPPHEPELSTIITTKMDTVSGDPRRQRTDPRRPNAHISTANTNSTTASVLNKPPQRSVHLDIQNILQKSNWYNECSSKQKIMVNQQLAIVSTELKKFHADQSENKIFDLNFINQNQLLQGVLTNLGIFINDDGEFVQLDQTSLGGNNMTAASAAARNSAGQQQGLVDLMSIPMDMDYLRNKQQHDVQQQQQAAALQAINALGGPRFLGQPGASQMLGFPMPGDVIRPGLLGIAPNMTLNEAYNLMQNPRENAAFYNRGSGGGNNNSGGGGGGNNRRTGGGMRRNQNFDRNNSRRK